MQLLAGPMGQAARLLVVRSTGCGAHAVNTRMPPNLALDAAAGMLDRKAGEGAHCDRLKGGSKNGNNLALRIRCCFLPPPPPPPTHPHTPPPPTPHHCTNAHTPG